MNAGLLKLWRGAREGRGSVGRNEISPIIIHRGLSMSMSFNSLKDPGRGGVSCSFAKEDTGA